MSDPLEIVACQTEDGSIINRTRRFAEAWNLKILPDRKAADADGRPLPDKYKTEIGGSAKAPAAQISEPAKTPDAPKEK